RISRSFSLLRENSEKREKRGMGVAFSGKREERNEGKEEKRGSHRYQPTPGALPTPSHAGGNERKGETHIERKPVRGFATQGRIEEGRNR
ncbi:hypothetical protein U1Q18_007407, partial [Sarracenia purpurea var. burkii]